MEWYQDESLWEVFYQCMFDEDSFQLAQQQVPQILEMVGRPVKQVLDLACGPGRHLLAFAKYGLDVTGVDSSAYLLNQAANKLAQQQLSANLVHADLLDFQTEQKFDLITNLFTSFGYYQRPQDNQRVLEQAHQRLAPSGTLVLETFGKEQLIRDIQPVHLTEYDNGDIRIERPLLTEQLQVLSNEWLLIRGEQVFRREYQHYVYTAAELTSMLQQAGFEQIRCYGSFQGDDYDLDAERLILVAEK